MMIYDFYEFSIYLIGVDSTFPLRTTLSNPKYVILGLCYWSFVTDSSLVRPLSHNL